MGPAEKPGFEPGGTELQASESYDVAIVGGGPAGSAAARLLASWGRHVVVLTRPESQTTLAVSLPPSCRKLFAELGVLSDVDAAGFFPGRGNTVWWGGGEARSEPFAEGMTGYQVVSRDLDRLLLGLAEEVGATVIRDAIVRRVDLPEAGAGASELEYGQAGTTEEPKGVFLTSSVAYKLAAGAGEEARGDVRARIVLDCSGRSGVVAREGLRVHEESAKTVALAGAWRRDGGWELDDETHTLVESYEDGWAWSVPVSAAVRYFTVMVDPRVTGLTRTKSEGPDEQLDAMYRAELAKTRHLKQLVEKAVIEVPPFGCDASLYCASRYAGPGFLLVGDAASFIDPLSSYGVKKALASAWMAAVVSNTCLSDPAMEGAALELYVAREQEVWERYRRQSAEFFEAAAADHDHPFWTGRAHPADPDPDSRAVGAALDVDSLRRDPDVLAAFEALKRSPSIRLKSTEGLERVERPAIRGHEVVLETQLRTPQMREARFLRGVDLPRLAEMAGEFDRVPDLFDAYNRTLQPVILPDFLGALSVLLAKGALVNEAEDG